MPIITAADLFENGADFEAVQWLTGNRPNFSSLEGLLKYTFGEEYQVPILELRQFQDEVQSSIIAANNVRGGQTIEEQDLPLLGPNTERDVATLQGVLSEYESPQMMQEGLPYSQMPFEATVPLILTQEDLANLFETNMPNDLRDYFVRSPGLVKKLEESGHTYTNVGDKTYEVYLTSIYRGRR